MFILQHFQSSDICDICVFISQYYQSFDFGWYLSVTVYLTVLSVFWFIWCLCVYLTAGALDGRQLAQLQILYKARGNKLEEMTKDFDQYKAETSREIRILKHQISLAKGKNTRYY